MVETIARLTQIYRVNYSKGWKNKTKPYDGIIEMLDELKRRGVRSAVLSNKPDDTTRATTAEFLGAERFDVVQGALSDLPLKPDPAMALEIARKMGLPPADFAYVGDTDRKSVV